MKIEKNSLFLVLIWEKDRESNIKENIPILAIGNAREILLLCKNILTPKISLLEFFKYYKKLAETLGYNTDFMEVLDFLKLLEKMKIIEMHEIPREVFM